MRGREAHAGGVRHISGGDWIVGQTMWRRNPRLVLPRAIFHVARLWDRCRGGMGGGLLPDDGGMNQQAAWLVNAFALLDAEDARLERERRN